MKKGRRPAARSQTEKASLSVSSARSAPPPGPGRPSASAAILDLIGMGFLFTLVFDLLFHPYFPNRQGLLGHDYKYFLPHLLAGDFWIHRNGLFSVPWFTPAFCGGIPVFANPQSPFYTVPQFLSAVLLNPLSAVYVTVLVFAWLGYAGMYQLLRAGFGVSRPAAILGAVLFMFNGLFVHRMMIGHLPFHAFMLTPALAWLLVRAPAHEGGASRAESVQGVAGAALVLTYMVMSGMLHILPPVLLAIGIIGILHRGLRGDRVPFWTRLGIAGALALLACLARLQAGSDFLAPFPRDDYRLPGAASVPGAVGLLLESLFVKPAYEMAQGGVLVNTQWLMEQHEFEYGVTFVPLVMLVAGGIAALGRWIRAGRPWPRARAIPETLLVVAVLAVPIAINCYTPSWNHVLKGLPILGSSSTLLRWFSLYIPVVIVGAVIAFDAIPVPALARQSMAAAGVVACVIVNLFADDSFYQRESYDPSPILAAAARIDEGVPDIRAIGDHAMIGDDGLVRGISPSMCYEPIFGYRLEHLPWNSLKPGPALEEHDGRINIKNPACYEFPAANHCAPGDHFTSAQKEQAEAFAGYRPFPFEMSGRQRVCNWISLLVLMALPIPPLLAGVRWLAGRRAAAPDAGGS